MAAPAKTIHTFKPAEHEPVGAAPTPLHRDDRQVIRHDFDDRRRMSVSEKLAEGRGFWRGAFVGLSIGAAGGIAASAGIANMWTPQIMQAVANSAVLAQTLAGADAKEAVRVVHPEVAVTDTRLVAPPAGPAGTSNR